MKIIKCDICRKTIKKDSKSIYVSAGKSMFSNLTEICLSCGKPILRLLEDKKIVKNIIKKDGK